MKKILIIIGIVIIILVLGGYYFYQQKSIINNQQNMNNSSNNVVQDNQVMTDLAKNIYQAFQQKDIEKIHTLAKTKIANDAVRQKKPLTSVEDSYVRLVSLDLNSQKERLLSVDFSSITFVPQEDKTFLVQVVYSERKSTKNLVVYLDNDPSLDMTSEYIIYIAKVGSVWGWVR